jgi:hypothetical protein
MVFIDPFRCVILLAMFTHASGLNGEIRTCSGHKLTGYRTLKKFVQDSKHAGSYYPGLKVKYMKGHNPDLVLFDDNGKETGRIDLAAYDARGKRVVNEQTLDTIHSLLREKGFTRARGSNQYLHFATKGKYRFLKFTVIETRAEVFSMVQMASFEFVHLGKVVHPRSARNPGGESPKGEGAHNLLQQSMRTKFVDKKGKPVIFDFGEQTEMDGFRWATGWDPNSVGRDPVRWTLEGSNTLEDNTMTISVGADGKQYVTGGASDGSKNAWTMLHDTREESFAVTEERSTWIIGNLHDGGHHEL